MPSQKTQPKATDIITKVAERIRTSDNVLVALSKDPSVDDLSAALGLTFMLDKVGKRATAIFSGAIPNAIEFLEPEKTFEANTDSLQDFIIALDKEKADHLRYKIDGDYVKVFITPYKTTIDERDMEFSHGDYNVDLVVSLNVSDESDLDAALSEYGRIMHDATSINISAGTAGHFGDLEWGNPEASSVSEMVGELADKIKEKDSDLLDKSISTALLAGIVAATNRFSNERTTPETMALASRLMMAGADQQLISSSIPVEILTEDTVDATNDFVEASTPTETSEAVVPLAQDTPKIELVAPEESAPAAETVEESAPAESVTEPAPTESAAESAIEEPVESAPEKVVESAPEEATEPAPEEVEEPAPVEEPVEKAKDPTEIDIRHGEVEFDPDEDLPEAERAAKAAAKAQAEAERQARIDAEMQKHAPIAAAIEEINAKNAARLAGNSVPKAAPAAQASAAPAVQASVESQAPATPSAVAMPETESQKDVPETEPQREESSAAPKKNIAPLGDVLNRKDPRKNYAEMMENELKGSAAPMPPAMPTAPVAAPVAPVTPPAMPTAPAMPAMPVAPAPIATQDPGISAPNTPLDNINAAEFVDPATVASANQSTILPPPPAPFTPSMEGFMPPETVATDPSLATPVQFDNPGDTAGLSAEQFASGVQATNPVVENTPLMNAGVGGYIVGSEPQPIANTATDNESAPTMPGVPADNGFIVGEPAPNPAPAPAPSAPVDDPSAFHIPGM